MRKEKPLLERVPFARFADHRGACGACAQVDPDKAATVSLACLTGVVMLKEAFNQVWHDDRAKRERRLAAGADAKGIT